MSKQLSTVDVSAAPCPLIVVESLIYSIFSPLYPQPPLIGDKQNIFNVTNTIRRLAGLKKCSGTPTTDWYYHGKLNSLVYISYKYNVLYQFNPKKFLPIWCPSDPLSMIMTILDTPDGLYFKRAKVYMVLWRLLEERLASPVIVATIISILFDLTMDGSVSRSSATLLELFHPGSCQKYLHCGNAVAVLSYPKFDLSNETEAIEASWSVFENLFRRMKRSSVSDLMTKDEFKRITTVEPTKQKSSLAKTMWQNFATGNITPRMSRNTKDFSFTVAAHLLPDLPDELQRCHFEFKNSIRQIEEIVVSVKNTKNTVIDSAPISIDSATSTSVSDPLNANTEAASATTTTANTLNDSIPVVGNVDGTVSKPNTRRKKPQSIPSTSVIAVEKDSVVASKPLGPRIIVRSQKTTISKKILSVPGKIASDDTNNIAPNAVSSNISLRRKSKLNGNESSATVATQLPAKKEPHVSVPGTSPRVIFVKMAAPKPTTTTVPNKNEANSVKASDSADSQNPVLRKNDLQNTIPTPDAVVRDDTNVNAAGAVRRSIVRNQKGPATPQNTPNASKTQNPIDNTSSNDLIPNQSKDQSTINADPIPVVSTDNEVKTDDSVVVKDTVLRISPRRKRTRQSTSTTNIATNPASQSNVDNATHDSDIEIIADSRDDASGNATVLPPHHKKIRLNANVAVSAESNKITKNTDDPDANVSKTVKRSPIRRKKAQSDCNPTATVSSELPEVEIVLVKQTSPNASRTRRRPASFANTTTIAVNEIQSQNANVDKTQ